MVRTRDYISWSQYSLWKKSKREYWKRYGLLEEQKSNRFFDKGKELAEGLENGSTFSNDPLYEQVLQAIPKLDIQEDKVEVILQNGEKILCWVDSANITNDEFLEYKTGKHPWTQHMVEEHDQLTFYALAYWLKSDRKLIPKCKLVWIETQETDEGLRYTGSIEEFERGFIVSELIDLEKDIIKTIDEIEEFEYTEAPLEDELVDRYIELVQAKKEIEAEMDIIKLEIKVTMETDNVNYASASRGRFGWTRRKTWFYSEELTNEENEFKAKFKKLKTAEQKDGTADYTETKYLNFNEIK